MTYLQDRFANREALNVENQALKNEIVLLKDKVRGAVYYMTLKYLP